MILMNTIKLSCILVLTTLTAQLSAKVAYLPLLRHNYDVLIYSPTATELLAVDLENGQRLKKITVGEGAGPVYLSHDDKTLYAAAQYEEKIVVIDTAALEILAVWEQLPVEPRLIFLNSAGDELFFSDNSELYSINLSGEQIELKLSGYNDQGYTWLYNEDLTHLMIYSPTQVDVYHLADMSLKSSFTASLSRGAQLSKSGEVIFSFDDSDDVLTAIDSKNGTPIWTFEPTSDSGLQIAQQDGNWLTVFGFRGTYKINMTSGEGVLSSTYTPYSRALFWAQWHSGIGDNQYLATGGVEMVTVTGWAWLLDHMKLIVASERGEVSYFEPFGDALSAAVPSGRFIGEKLYSIPVVTVNDLWLIFVLIGVVFLVTMSVLLRQNGSLNDSN